MNANTNIESDTFFENCGFRILKALRGIIHASDSYSRRLNSLYNITAPQMMCLYSLVREGAETQAELLNKVDLGASTVNGIVDRLEAKGLILRERSQTDRRRVLLRVTEQGRQLASSPDTMIHPNLADGLRALPELEQAAIALSLERILDLVNTPSTKKPGL